VYTKPFVLTSLAYLLFFSNVNAYNLLPLYIQALGGREGEIGTIMAMFSVAAILGQATLGGLLDRWPRKPVLLAATGILTAVSAAFVSTTHLGGHFYGFRFLQGAALAVFTTSNLTLIGELAPPGRRAEAVGIYGAAGLMAVALGPALGEVVLRAWGFHLFFLATVLVAGGALVLTWATPMPPAGPTLSAPRLGWTFWRAYLPVLLPVFQYGLANAILFVFLPPFARQVGLARVGPFYLAYTGAAIAVRFCAGGLADRFGRQRVILPSLVGMTVGLLICSVLHATWLLVLIGVVNGTAQGFVFPATSALAFDQAPLGRRNQALAIYNIANLLGAALGASGFGWLAENLGYRPGFVLAACVLAPGVLYSVRPSTRA
jgi:MFS family permease